MMPEKPESGHSPEMPPRKVYSSDATQPSAMSAQKLSNHLTSEMSSSH
jgi:hypothetical protein